MTDALTRSRRLGSIGSVVGLLALVAAILPHWVLPAIDPPPPIDKVLVDVGHRVKDRLVARIKGVDYQAPVRERSWTDRLHQQLPLAAVSLGLLAIILGVVGQLRREERHIAAMATTLGGCAIAVQLSFVLMGVLIVVAIIYFIGDFLSLS
ncbi:conserved membrane protein of unknown function [Bradyrhizobium sp. ORS 285]|uniref:hypothetical protein n=1 Tax=Bradyrhizobium sp. ORS 285 TaxID=115808 RepID=UPI000240A012|nr:hypothetical protein [Bradyrhizobium sp. ORS 285]CCD86403.1 conserved membrane hypothetical protein [Bradyrhizobium sp. ORS 285]SMX61132.1 conserved membrane protein of unknown function [Bradyrhizobium sp. ORS 285]